MNRFERAVHECMLPTAELLERTTVPLHRAMLLNFWRHMHLEGAGDFERIDHVASRQAFIWPYDHRARLVGEHLYEDKTSLAIEEVDRADAITPARVREIHGERFWVLGNG